MAKIIMGGFIIIALDFRFKYYYLRVMYHLSVISLIFFSLQTIFDLTFSLIDVGKVGKSILFYFSHNRAFDRNCGAFWEPGAYGCYLMFVPLLFINKLRFLFINYKKECIVIFIALLTTQSTTAFLSLGILAFSFLLLQLRTWYKYIYLAICIIVTFFVYNNVAFLHDKIQTQTVSTIKSNGAFNATRTGSFMFDMHYIKKHPIIGNGLHGRTRYADHTYLMDLWAKEELAKSGNSFSDYLAKMGILFYLTFFFILHRTNYGIKGIDFFVFTTVFIMLLFGEPLLNYPMGLSLPFVKILNSNDILHNTIVKQRRGII